MANVNLTFHTESEVLNALPSGSIISTWESQMKSFGQAYMDAPPIAGASIYDDEHSVLYYDGAIVFYLQYLYWDGVDQTYADNCLVMSNYLWGQYESVYGAFGYTSVDPRYKSRSQWVFPQGAEQFSASHLYDMCFFSSYASYLDGHDDAYLDSDARGIGYLFDAYMTYKATTGLDVINASLGGRNQTEHLIGIVENYADNLGPVDGKTKEVLYMLGILSNAIMKHRYLLKPYFRPYQVVDKILKYLSDFVEPSNNYRMRYGDGFIDDGAGNNEAVVYYPGLEMIATTGFRWHKKYQTITDGMFEYSVNNTILSQPKDYVEHYRWSLQYIDRTL